jgi:hypothetical protein
MQSLSDERYLAALIRVRDLIAKGERLVANDSEEIGNKYTECTWGLCSGDKKAWPDPQDYMWPDQPDRVAPKYRTNRQVCPFRRAPPSANGCFWSCMIFKPKGKPVPTREEALALYDAKIKEVQAWISRK